MARDNAIEFTENKYASRKEMSNEIGIVVPNEMWNKILNYRANFMNKLALLDVSDRPINLCLYVTLANKCSLVEAKLNKLLDKYNNLDALNGSKQHFHLEMLTKVLENIAVNNNLPIEPARIKKLIVSENPYDEDEEKLLNYMYALEFIEENYGSKIDVDYLAGLYSKVSGIEELTYFYRKSEINDIDSLALINRVYRTAPSDKIEKMMDNLFYFIGNSELSALNKAIITFYYVTYVRPFKDYNDEIACLLAKSVLAHFTLGEISSLLPVEKILLEKDEVIRKMFQEVQTSTDITYFVSPMVNRFDKDLDESFDILREHSISEVRKDFYRPDPVIVTEEVKEDDKPIPTPVVEEKKPEPVSDSNNPLGLLFDEEPVKEEKIEPVNEVKEVVEKEPVPLIEEEKEEPVVKTIVETKPVPTPVVKEKIIEPQVEEISEIEEIPQGLAIGVLPQELDEKDAKRLEVNLLELDVRLKKGEAKFYARHCTLGRYYTIEQYKKLNRCVYETARTSMEHLVELGYYKKAKAGKKFVYTPVKR